MRVTSHHTTTQPQKMVYEEKQPISVVANQAIGQSSNANPTQKERKWGKILGDIFKVLSGAVLLIIALIGILIAGFTALCALII